MTEIECDFDFLKKIDNRIRIKYIDINKKAIDYCVVNKNYFKYNCIFYLDKLLTNENRVIFINNNILILEDLMKIWKTEFTNIHCIGYIEAAKKKYIDLLLIDLKTLRLDHTNDKLIPLLNKKIFYDDTEIFEIYKYYIKSIDVSFSLPNINFQQLYHNEFKLDKKISLFKSLNKPITINYVKVPWTEKIVLYGDIWKQYYRECKYLEHIVNNN